MKKLFLKILFCLTFIIPSVEAYECYYNYHIPKITGSAEVEGKLTIDEKNKTFKYTSTNIATAVGFDVIDSSIDNSWTDSRIITEYLKNQCPPYITVVETQYGCTYRKKDSVKYTAYQVILNHNLASNFRQEREIHFEGTSYPGACDNSDRYIRYGEEYIAVVDSEKTIPSIMDVGFPCDIYDDFYDQMKTLACSDPTNLKTCSIKNIGDKQQYYKLKDKIK